MRHPVVAGAGPRGAWLAPGGATYALDASGAAYVGDGPYASQLTCAGFRLVDDQATAKALDATEPTGP